MLKLLLGHWQAHRQPLPFVLTDDPLYCSHLTKAPFPEVYSVNRVNPIFEDDEPPPSPIPLKRSVSDETRYSIRRSNEAEEPFPLDRSLSDETRYSIKRSISDETRYSLKRSLSEERRENETRSSDDTGYSSSGHLKSVTTADSLTTDDAASLRHMSSDSEDYSQPEAVVVSVDVHRVSYPEDVIVLSTSSSPSRTFSANSISSHYSDSPYDSLTMSSNEDNRQKMNSKKPNLAVREKLQRLLEKGTDRSSESFLDSLEAKTPAVEHEIEKTKGDLMQSLTRALSGRVPNNKEDSNEGGETVTRTDSALDISQKSLDLKSISSSTSPKTLYFSNSSITNGVTRQDESSPASSISFVKHKRPRNSKHPAEKESKRGSLESSQESSDSKKSHKCKLCENAKRPLAFHQLLPGHWSYDNVYLPQISGMCCSCVHHPPSFPPSSDDDVFYPLYYPQDVARARHSWANPTSKEFLEKVPKRKRSAEDKSTSTNKDKNQKVALPRYSPDGSSRETTDSSTDSSQLKKSLSERRSLREPKKCKCEHCLASVLDKNRPHQGSHTCPCHYLQHRRVKFASDTDVSQHKHMHSVPIHFGKDGKSKLANGETINAAFVMNLPHLNGHALSNSQGGKVNGLKSKKAPPLIPRGLKEPIKVSSVFRRYLKVSIFE